MTCTDPGGPPDFDNDGTLGILDLLYLLANVADADTPALPAAIETTAVVVPAG